MPAALLRTARPRQWLKNVLVFAAPAAAGVLSHAHALGQAAVAFVLFCLAASGTYFLNDAVDVEADRAHPSKCQRPVAAGLLSVSVAVGVGVGAMVLAAGMAVIVGRPRLALVVVVYVVVTAAYSLWLKHEPILELAAVAAGFVLRAIAGGVATAVPLSNWFLIVACAGSLLIVSGKRHAEHLALGDTRADHRPALARYSLPFLRYVRSVSSSITLTAYFLWAFDKAHTSGRGGIWIELSVVPFALAVLRYALLLDEGQGGAPEDVLLEDRTLQVLGALLLAALAIGIYRK